MTTAPLLHMLIRREICLLQTFCPRTNVLFVTTTSILYQNTQSNYIDLYCLRMCKIRHATFIHICNCYVCVHLYAYVKHMLRIRMCDICTFTCEMDILSKVTVSALFCLPPEKVYSNCKEFAPFRIKFFPFRADLVSDGVWCVGMQT